MNQYQATENQLAGDNSMLFNDNKPGNRRANSFTYLETTKVKWIKSYTEIG